MTSNIVALPTSPLSIDYGVVGDEGWQAIHEKFESESKAKTTKGGPGSGNFGHAGRPGVVGGSESGGSISAGVTDEAHLLNKDSNVVMADKYVDLYMSPLINGGGLGICYFILPSGDLASIKGHDSAHYNITSGVAIDKPELMGFTPEDTEFARTHDSYDGGYLLVDKAVKNGSIQVRIIGRTLNIRTNMMDTKTLHRLQKLDDQGKLPIFEKVTWGGYEVKSYLEADKNDLMTAKYIRNYELKEIATKGGPGSGNFGHAGRPGKVGGSATHGAIDRGMVDKPAFKKWFGKSKVVDETGKPLVMYHGTPAGEFAKFDIEKADKGALYGPGAYFTDDPEIASEYSNNRQVSRGTINGFKPDYELSRKLTEEDMNKVEDGLLEQQAAYSRSIPKQKAKIDKLFADGKITAEQRREQRQAVNDYDMRFSTLLINVTTYDAGINPPSWVVSHKIDELEYYMTRVDWSEDMLHDILPDVGRKYVGKLSTVYPVYMSIQHPFDMDQPITAKEAETLHTAFEKEFGDEHPDPIKNPTSAVPVFKEGEKGDDVFNHVVHYMEVYHNNNQELGSKGLAVYTLFKAGYDGITHIGGRRVGYKDHRVFIAWDPGQVKSALAATTFDPTMPEMAKEKR